MSAAPEEKKTLKPFDINESSKGFMLPSPDALVDVPGSLILTDLVGYQRSFEMMLGLEDPIKSAAKALGIDAPKYAAKDTIKALAAVPTAFTYGRMSFMPDAMTNGGVIAWPGINPDSLRKVAKENVAPQLIIGMRVDDMLRYSNYSTHIWRPGWRLEERFKGPAFDSTDEEAVDDSDDEEEDEKQSKALRADILEARRFLENSNIETRYTQTRRRDQAHLTGFQRFLSAATRDSLTYDGIALWTDMTNDDKVKAYALLPAGNIRLCTPQGYNNNPAQFAVAVDEGGRVIQPFTRDELTFYVRNPRNDPEVFGYGYPEIEIALRVIKGFQNALDMNIDIFDRSAVANGILTISGGSVTQKQLDLLTRMFTNMKKGITKWWALPVMGLPADSKLELVDLTRLKGNEAYYKEFMNMLAGALATLWRFPVRRLGYKISGSHRDSEPLPDSSVTMIDEDDPGMAPLLTHFEVLINEYLIWTRWPHLQFRFTGKSPKEDARNYEFQNNARTWGESRRESGLPPLEKVAPSKLKKFAELLSLTPNDPNKSGVFQTLAGQLLKAESEEKMAKEQGAAGPDGKGGKDIATPGNRMTSNKDPASSESHGAISGVRRDSNKEGTRARAKQQARAGGN